VPNTGATTLIDLGAAGSGTPGADGGSDDRGCTNAGTVKNDNGDGLLIAACSGSYPLADGGADTRGRAVVQIDPVNNKLVHTLSTAGVYGIAAGSFQPDAVAGGPSKIWIGDTFTPTLISVTRATFTLADGASASAPPIALPCADAADSYLYVADLLANGNDLFALCSGDPDGYIVQLDANTGAVKGTPQLVGATPVAMALLGDGRIAVVNSIDETLALVTPGGGALSDGGTAGPKVQTKAYTCAQCQSLSDVKARGLFVYLVDSSTNTALKLDLSQTDPAKMLVNEVNTGDNSSPWAILPLDDNQALVSNNGLGALVGVNFSTAADAGTAGDAGSN